MMLIKKLMQNSLHQFLSLTFCSGSADCCSGSGSDCYSADFCSDCSDCSADSDCSAFQSPFSADRDFSEPQVGGIRFAESIFDNEHLCNTHLPPLEEGNSSLCVNYN